MSMKPGQHRGVKKVLEEMEAPAKGRYVNQKPVQILMNPEDHAKFKTLCYLRGVKMTEITLQLIAEWVEKEAAKATWLK